MTNQKKKNLLITGIAGFIGSHLCEGVLKNTDWNIIGLDRLDISGNLRRLTEMGAWEQEKHRVRVVWWDLKAELNEQIIKEIGDIDYIWHVAASSIPENIYLPIQSTPDTGTRMMTFGELWEQQSSYNKIQKIKYKDGQDGEVIFLKGKQVKALSFLNGGQWMPIKNITRHQYKGKIIKLKQKFGSVDATPNHSIYSSNLELTNPTTNPELLVIRNINERKKKYKKANNNILQILAAYITEGNTTFNIANGGYTIEISQNRKYWLENIGKLIKKEFGLNYCIIRHKKIGHKDVFGLQISNKKFFNYLRKNCSYYSENKFFPNWIFDISPKQREFFWNKLLEGDGTEDGRYATTSYKLVNQLSLLLGLQGKYFTIFENNTGRTKTLWEIKTELSGQHYGLSQRKKEEIDYEGWVYDIEVEKSHNFVCGIGNVVCHNSHVNRSISDPMSFVMDNVVGTCNLLEYARKIKPKLFINFGTDEIFGIAPIGIDYNEWDRYKSGNPYAASKAGAEELCIAYENTYKLPIICIHSMNVFGERQHPEKFIPFCIGKIIKGERVSIHADKTKSISGSRKWIHARNINKALLFLTEKGIIGDKYNIVGEELSNLEIAEFIAKIIGKPLNFELVSWHESRPGHDLRYSLSGDKLYNMGFRFSKTFSESMSKTIEWYLEHKEWLSL